MKKIKITEKQAKMIKEMSGIKIGNTRVAKENLPSNRMDKEAAKLGIKEMYEQFINEVYGLNESESSNYGELIKLMEMAGFISDGKIVKEKFNDDAEVVKETISSALYEMSCGGSAYKAMDTIEEASKQEPPKPTGIERSIHAEPSFVGTKSDKSDEESLKQFIIQKRKEEKARREREGEPIDVERKGNPLDEDSEQTGIVGYDILEHPPLNTFTEKRDFKNGVSFPGDVKPHGLVISSHMSSELNSRPEVIQYIDLFEEKYGELPIFVFVGDKKVSVVNDNEAMKHDMGTTGRGVTSMGGKFNETDATSSGSFVPPLGYESEEKEPEQSNVSDEILTELDVDGDVAMQVRELDSMVSHNTTPDELFSVEGRIREILGGITSDDIGPRILKDAFALLFNIAGVIMQGGSIESNEVAWADYNRVLGGIRNIIMKLKSSKEQPVDEQGIGSVGAYDTNPFNDAELKGDNKKGKGPTHKKTMIPTDGTLSGGGFVEIKEKCKKSPYCDQGADAITIKESVESDDLANAIISAMDSIGEKYKKVEKGEGDYSFGREDFAMAVAKVLSTYGEPNYGPFIDVLKKELTLYEQVAKETGKSFMEVVSIMKPKLQETIKNRNK